MYNVSLFGLLLPSRTNSFIERESAAIEEEKENMKMYFKYNLSIFIYIPGVISGSDIFRHTIFISYGVIKCVIHYDSGQINATGRIFT